MTRRSVLAIVGVALVPLLVSPVVAQGGGGGGGGRGPGAGGGQRRGGMGGGMMNFIYLERTWTIVCFQVDVTGEQYTALKPTYRNALSARDAAIKAAMEAQDWAAMGKAMEDCKTRLETKLKEVLSSTQMTKLNGLLMPQMPRRGGGGRGGGGGGRGPGGGGGGGGGTQ